ncbi:MAG: ribonuclease HII, partial [Thermococci archaeon]|nr:ribonuclease HII [Thermococci archaeon]
EAGRGPVIGPMVVAAVVIEEGRVEDLSSIGVRDSKKLSPARRERLFEEILSTVDEIKVRVVPPEVVGDPAVNVNDLEVQVFGDVLNSLSLRPSVIYVDAADVDAERFASRLRERLSYEALIVAEHRADDRYPVVSAASIVAKVIRDREIEKIREVYGDVGSGYPSDPRTRRFLEDYLREHGDFPPVVRRSWKTLKKIREKSGRVTLDRFLGH